MAATMKRAVVTVDDVEISAEEAHYVVRRTSNQVGRRLGGSMEAKAFFWADISDQSRNDADKIIKLWKMATETEDPLHKVEIAFYAEDANKRVQTIKFQGWVSVFETFNPAISGNGAGASSIGGSAGPTMTAQRQYGNLLYCELSVVLDETNFSRHQVTK
jgi:hypothetical protein